MQERQLGRTLQEIRVLKHAWNHLAFLCCSLLVPASHRPWNRDPEILSVRSCASGGCFSALGTETGPETSVSAVSRPVFRPSLVL